MGLEAVYIVCETEALFGISITDAEAGRCLTPEDLIRLVQSKLLLATSSECVTQRVFYRLRRALRAVLPELAADPRLDTPLATVVSKDAWPALWAAVRALAGDPGWPAEVPWPTRWFNLGDAPRTLRDLAWYVASSLPPANTAEGEPWTSQQVELSIRRIVAEELGQQRGFRKDATFRSLGVS
jgi:hypothetical protein